MTPPAKDPPAWFSKVLLSCVGALMALMFGWAARGYEKQATAMENLKDAVNAGKTDTAVLKNEVENVKSRVLIIEAKLSKEK